MRAALRDHWPEYLIEGWAVGSLMIAVSVGASYLLAPKAALSALIPSSVSRTGLLAVLIGATLTSLIHSPWGKRSGAHMNPAITLAFLRLRKVHPWDALFYVLTQVAGGIAGVLSVAFLLGRSFTDPPIRYAVTVPGPAGVAVAFVAEAVISGALMATILALTSSPRRIGFTGVAVGALVAVFIVMESAFSGTSMNPARTLASAVPARMWAHLWLYLLAPTLGMLAAAEIALRAGGSESPGCAKLLHPPGIRCIHCGYGVDPRANESTLTAKRVASRGR
jgi:aquaporin Z